MRPPQSSCASAVAKTTCTDRLACTYRPVGAKSPLRCPSIWRVRVKKSPRELGSTPPPTPPPSTLSPTFERDGKAWAWREDRIDYAHIPLQIVLQPSRLRLVPVNLPQHQGLVGYIDGSGDSVADDLAHVGFTIERLTDDVLRSGNLQRFAAIVVGIRAYNTRPALPTVQSRLMQYVEQGGILLTQYQTNNRLAPLTLPLGPYPFSIGRERVTEEGAPVSFINAKHAVLNTPARLGAADFADWVQERGLYFADTWGRCIRADFCRSRYRRGATARQCPVCPLWQRALYLYRASIFSAAACRRAGGLPPLYQPAQRRHAMTLVPTTPNPSSTPNVPWRRLYILLIVELSVVVAACYALTRWAA